MPRVLVSSGSDFEARIGFSRAVRVGNMISVSGTAPIAESGGTEGIGSVYRQTARCLDIIRQALQDAGASTDNVVRTRIMLTDISQWNEAAKAHAEVFSDVRPASTFVQVAGFIDADWLVEVEADAIVPCA